MDLEYCEVVSGSICKSLGVSKGNLPHEMTRPWVCGLKLSQVGISWFNFPPDYISLALWMVQVILFPPRIPQFFFIISNSNIEIIFHITFERISNIGPDSWSITIGLPWSGLGPSFHSVGDEVDASWLRLNLIVVAKIAWIFHQSECWLPIWRRHIILFGGCTTNLWSICERFMK